MKRKLITIGLLGLILLNIVYGANKPIVGQDKDLWGNKLNEFLEVSLNNEGYIKNKSINSNMINFTDIVISKFTNDANYLTAYTETDPIWGSVKTSYYNKTEADALLDDKQNTLIGSESVFDSWDKNSGNDFDGNYNNLINKPTTLTQFTNDANFISTLPDSYVSSSNAIYMQPNKDGTARVRFFTNTSGSPLISIFGYNSALNSRPWIYMGMFDIGSSGNMRGVIGASGDYGDNAASIEIQSPYQVRITGVDNNIATGNVRMASRSYITFHPRTLAETDSAKYLTVDTVSQGQGNNVELSTNSGDLVLNPSGDVSLKGGYTGTCDLTTATTLTVIKGVITNCA